MQPVPEKTAGLGLQVGKANTTDIEFRSRDRLPTSFTASGERVIFHYPDRILLNDHRNKQNPTLVEVSRDQLRTFSGETVVFRQAKSARDMSVLLAAAQGDSVLFLVGHQPSRGAASSRIENDHLFSLDLKSGRISQLDEIFGQDFEIADIAADRSAVYLSFPHKGKVERYAREENTWGLALWRNSLNRLQRPKGISVLNDRGVVILEGGLPDGQSQTSSLIVSFDTSSGNETSVAEIPLMGPQHVQLISPSIAIVGHSGGIAAVEIQSGRTQDLVTGPVSGFDFDAANSTLYYILPSDTHLLKRKLELAPRRLADSADL